MITVALSGETQLAERLAGFPQRVQQRLAAVMTRLGVELLDRVEDNLSGGLLESRSGRLAAAQEVVVSGDPLSPSVSVGFDPAQVPYGAIQEFGGSTRAHLIEAKRGFALAFTMGDRLVFAKRVQHPGSVIPAHGFLRAALADTASDAAGEVESAVLGELHP